MHIHRLSGRLKLLCHVRQLNRTDAHHRTLQRMHINRILIPVLLFIQLLQLIPVVPTIIPMHLQNFHIPFQASAIQNAFLRIQLMLLKFLQQPLFVPRFSSLSHFTGLRPDRRWILVILFFLNQFFLRDKSPENTLQCRQFDGLCQKTGKAFRQKHFPHTGHSIGSQCHNRQHFVIFSRHTANSPQCLNPIHFRHHMVHKHQIEIPFLQTLQSLCTAFCHYKLYFIWFQQIFQHLQVHPVIIYGKNSGLRCFEPFSVTGVLINPLHRSLSV